MLLGSATAAAEAGTPLCREVIVLTVASAECGANFGLGWGLGGHTGGGDNRGGPRVPLTRLSRPRRPKVPHRGAEDIQGRVSSLHYLTTSNRNRGLTRKSVWADLSS